MCIYAYLVIEFWQKASGPLKFAKISTLLKKRYMVYTHDTCELKSTSKRIKKYLI